jgi:hypothetical protein
MLVLFETLRQSEKDHETSADRRPPGHGLGLSFLRNLLREENFGTSFEEAVTPGWAAGRARMSPAQSCPAAAFVARGGRRLRSEGVSATAPWSVRALGRVSAEVSRRRHGSGGAPPGAQTRRLPRPPAEIRTALGNYWGQTWGNPTLYFELTSQYYNSPRAEFRLLMGGTVFTPKLLAALNLGFERSIYRDSDTTSSRPTSASTTRSSRAFFAEASKPHSASTATGR